MIIDRVIFLVEMEDLGMYHITQSFNNRYEDSFTWLLKLTKQGLVTWLLDKIEDLEEPDIKIILDCGGYAPQIKEAIQRRRSTGNYIKILRTI